MPRITFTTMYDTSIRNLQRNAVTLSKLEEQLMNEKRINRPSDNPIGFTNALRYTNTLSALGQQQLTMNDGQVYMTVLENTHNSMNKVFGRCQDLAVQASNDTVNHEQRLFTNLEVRQLLEQLVADSQTKHKDGYIFNGKWTNYPPYEIRSSETIYDPSHRPSQLPYEFPTSPVDFTTLTDYTVSYSSAQPTALATPIGPIKLWDASFEDPNSVPIPNDYPRAQRIIPGTVTGLPAGWLEKSHLEPPNDPTVVPDYEIDYVNGTLTLLSDRARAAFYNPADPNGTPPTTEATLKNPDEMPSMKFDYVYRNPLADMNGAINREIDTNIVMKINANPNEAFGKGGENDTDAFKEIISLMQGLWYNDQPQIAKSIDTIDVGRKRNLAAQAVEGARLNRLEITFDRNEDMTITNTKGRSEIEDVNIADALTQFSLAEAVYSASLYATSRLMQQSLMNFL